VFGLIIVDFIIARFSAALCISTCRVSFLSPYDLGGMFNKQHPRMSHNRIYYLDIDNQETFVSTVLVKTKRM